MSIALETLVDPHDYDDQIYDLVHQVMDRTIELASKADKFDPQILHDELNAQDDDPEGEGPVISLLRSQANFTPAEQSEFQLVGMLLNTLMGTCIARRAALYANQEEE